jgi:hypothetical protein
VVSRTATGLAIRSSSLVAIALFLAWYALLGGWRVLYEALPETAPLAPAPISTPASDSTEIPLRSFIELALLVAAGALVLLARRIRARRLSTQGGKMMSPTERRLWVEHLAWLGAISEEEKSASARLGQMGMRRMGAQDPAPATSVAVKGDAACAGGRSHGAPVVYTTSTQ